MLRDVPQNQGYMIAGYAVCFAILVGYASMLLLRAGKAGRREDGKAGGAGTA